MEDDEIVCAMKYGEKEVLNVGELVDVPIFSDKAICFVMSTSFLMLQPSCRLLSSS